MNMLGVNITQSKEFCSDFLALFWKHIWTCDDCFDKIFIGSILYFLVVFLFFILYNMFCDWFEKKLDKLKYKKDNEELKAQIKECNDMIDALRLANHELSSELSRIEN